MSLTFESDFRMESYWLLRRSLSIRPFNGGIEVRKDSSPHHFQAASSLAIRRGLLQHGEHLTRQCGHWSSVSEAGVGDTVVAGEGDAGEGTREHSVSQAFAVVLAPKQSSQQS